MDASETERVGSRPERDAGASIGLSQVEKHYGPVRAVGGISLEARAGEFLSLLGPSGSGKTTILMMVAGFETPDVGSIAVGGRDVTHVPANRRNVGMVFQRYALFPHMTVAENIAFPLKMRGTPRGAIAARVDEALALVRLDGYAARLPSQLSGGQQQRVALARAIVFHPPVLLMDEPLAALDRKLRQAMQLEVRRLQKKLGLTVLYVTHDQEEALTMSDRIAVLRDGCLEQIGSPEDLYENPASPFVAEFIGESNFVAGDVVGMSDGICRLRIASGLAVCGRAAGNGLAPGSAARLAVRPERLHLAAAGEGLEGTIVDRVYVGAVVNHVVRIDAQLDLTARLPGPAAHPWRIGQRVRVSWQPGDARVYSAKADGP
jgi:spermidine/putrescine ABC transporter ATP-binding subunit